MTVGLIRHTFRADYEGIHFGSTSLDRVQKMIESYSLGEAV